MNQNNNSINLLDLVANISQLISIYLLLREASNDDLMKELQNQNTKYFEDIIKKLDEINKKLSLK